MTGYQEMKSSYLRECQQHFRVMTKITVRKSGTLLLNRKVVKPRTQGVIANNKF